VMPVGEVEQRLPPVTRPAEIRDDHDGGAAASEPARAGERLAE
jgi:hypothetical protein